MVKIDEAINLINNYNYQRKIININLEEALHYVSASDIHSNIDVPHFNRSAMDGYALRSEDLNKHEKFKVIKTIYAGDDNDTTLKSGEAVKIMTGAKVCNNADKVIVKELANVYEDDYVSFNIPNVILKDNISYIGEDICKDSKIISKKTFITPTVLAVLKSCGVSKIDVYDKPKILILTTGDELLKDNLDLDKPHIYNSNEIYLNSRLNELGFTNIVIKNISDDINELKKIVKEDYDLLITTGAISVGDKDIIRLFIKENNDSNIIFDKINIMPGGPTCFWEYKNKPVISLAGSPFANLVTFELLVPTFLSNYTNNNNLKFKVEKRILNGVYEKKVKKLRFVKIKIDNKYANILTNNHNATTLSEMINCNGFLVVKPNEVIKNNDEVDVIILGANNG